MHPRLWLLQTFTPPHCTAESFRTSFQNWTQSHGVTEVQGFRRGWKDQHNLRSSPKDQQFLPCLPSHETGQHSRRLFWVAAWQPHTAFQCFPCLAQALTSLPDLLGGFAGSCVSPGETLPFKAPQLSLPGASATCSAHLCAHSLWTVFGPAGRVEELGCLQT